ncbi:MAG: ArnT family glycosyltransferase [Armatimonadota bacterium]
MENRESAVEYSVQADISRPRFSWARVGAAVGVFVGLALVAGRFYQNNFDGLWSREAIDQAQIADQIASGAGYTTRFIRPFNVALVPRGLDYHTEINHAPIYPHVLAAAFKVRSISDQVAAWTSLAFLFATLVAAYFLGGILFDWRAGLLAASALGVNAAVLRIGTGGQQWTMAALWFTLLLIVLALHHRAQPNAGMWMCAARAFAAAVCTVLLYMTHHVLIFVALPAAIFFGVTGAWRKLSLIVYAAAAVLMSAPWAYRNYEYTGIPVLGVNAWDLMSNTSAYPGDALYRSTSAEPREIGTLLLFPIEHFSAFAQKLVDGSAQQISAMVAVFGFVVIGFALVSVLYRFRNPSANAVRGLMYGLLPAGVVSFALYSAGTDAVVIFAPVFAVFASAYFLLLLDARKLHAFYKRVLVGCFVLLSASQTIAPLFWAGLSHPTAASNKPAHDYARMLASRGVQYPIYADAPWIFAYRCKWMSAWVPLTDADFTAMSAVGFPLGVIILTPESDNYSTDEIWYVLHKVRMWREYIRDPKDAVRQILEMARGKIRDKSLPAKYIQRLKRQFAVSKSLDGFVPQPQDPLLPDDIQVFVREGAE